MPLCADRHLLTQGVSPCAGRSVRYRLVTARLWRGVAVIGSSESAAEHTALSLSLSLSLSLAVPGD